MVRNVRIWSLLVLLALILSACQAALPVAFSESPGSVSVVEEGADFADAPTVQRSGPTPTLLFDMVIELEQPRDIGSGELGLRYVSYFEGGRVMGEALEGEILPEGEQWFLIRRDCVAELNIRGLIQTADGEQILFTANGFSRVAPATMEQVFAGELVDPSDALFRGVTVFDTTAPQFDWLTDTVTISLYRYDLNRVQISVYTFG
jgi:hypothetical protein